MFTASQLATMFMWMCGAIITVSGAITVISKWVSKAKEPNKAQDARLDEHERRLKSIEEKLSHDDKRIIALEEGMHASLDALHALLKHSIDGNDIAGLKNAEEDLRKFLMKGRFKE